MAGFWKSHGKRDSLITMLKKWTNSLEKDEFLSVNGCVTSLLHNHSWLIGITKLHAYSFWDKTLNLLCSDLKERKKTFQLNNSFDSEKKCKQLCHKVLLIGRFYLTYLLMTLRENSPYSELFWSECG